MAPRFDNRRPSACGRLWIWSVDDEGWKFACTTSIRNKSGLLAIRLHVDESGIDNGPLRVIAGSHRRGRLSTEQIGKWNKETSVTCTIPKGGALVMRPLLLHASPSCALPKPRRVIHLEFATAELPHGLDWHDRIQMMRRIPSPGPD